jgi:hypothetical protein
MSVLTDVADVLSSGGITTPIFKGTLPSTPDDLIGLFETGGAAPVHAMNRGPGTALAERPHVQLLVRDTRPDDAKKTAQDATRLLDGLGRRINGILYGSVFALQSPFFLKVDETSRVIYAVNFECTRVPASSS